MAESSGAPPPQRRVPPTITLPPRSLADTFLTGTGISPGPMTFVSNFFSDHYPDADIQSFSRILAGIVPFPVVGTPTPSTVSRPENRPFLVAKLEEESEVVQTSDPDNFRIESYSGSESRNSDPETVVMGGSTCKDFFMLFCKTTTVKRCHYCDLFCATATTGKWEYL